MPPQTHMQEKSQTKLTLNIRFSQSDHVAWQHLWNPTHSGTNNLEAGRKWAGNSYNILAQFWYASMTADSCETKYQCELHGGGVCLIECAY